MAAKKQTAQALHPGEVYKPKSRMMPEKFFASDSDPGTFAGREKGIKDFAGMVEGIKKRGNMKAFAAALKSDVEVAKRILEDDRSRSESMERSRSNLMKMARETA